jgi:ankyrin repeat protein
MIPLIQLDIDQEIFIYTNQIEIFKILLDDDFFENIVDWFAGEIDYTVQLSLNNLIEINRLNMILFVHQYDAYVLPLFRDTWDTGETLDFILANRTRKQLFYALIENEPFRTWSSTDSNILFALLKKKQSKLVKKYISLLPMLVHQLDKEDNNPLLYVCLKVRGCRHNLVEYLIKMGCDLQVRNSNGEDFINGLKLGRNRKLLKTLVERGTIEIDNDSGVIKVISDGES